MANSKTEITLIRPEQILAKFAYDAWSKSMPEIQKWMATSLIHDLVYGGNGITGIEQTDFYRFVSSSLGLSELGIDVSEPRKLLEAYATRAFQVDVASDQVTLQFGDWAKLKASTPHPADGTGNLHIDSWLEWVDGLEVGRGFVERKDLNADAQKAVRLGSPLGGLMLPRGAYNSTGLWRFPTQLKNYEDKWFRDNEQRIENVLISKMLEVFTKNLIG